ncbi:HYC_CC_PP family protein [Hanstruepera ponticola]|uniref:HYC_CC_PP family protein n=1 Tax=Hanstruepera ponticola TaxID=2042995 RepID=UPI001F47FB23|nr:hypothetical protein [Hanstruepera ponticola]
MKKFFHKIMSLVMAFVVLFSTMSFTMNMHYCGGALVETAIFQKAKGCGMEMEKPAIEGCSITKKNCCDDKQLAIEGQDELQLQFDKITFEQQVFITSFIHTYINLFEGFDKDITSYEKYEPPLVIRRIYKIDETYLI